MHELTEEEQKKELDKLLKEAKTKKFKCPKGHTIDFMLTGTYDYSIIYCDKCYKGYKLNKEEVEQL